RLLQYKSAASRTLKDGSKVRVHLGSGNWGARLFLLGQKEIAPGENCIARLSFDTPIFALVEERLIIRDSSDKASLAGAVVLANEGPRGILRDPARQRFLLRCAAAIGEVKSRIEAQVAYEGMVRRSELLVKSRIGAEEVSSQIDYLIREGKVVG